MSAFSPLSINIASQPFRRERAQNAAFALICAGLLCSLLLLVMLILHARAQASDLRKVIAGEYMELSRLQRNEAMSQSTLAKPENADVFSTSVFLNQLIARRAVSWVRVFSDLAVVMPTDMRLIGVRLPQVGTDEAADTNRVQLDMMVGTARPQAVIELLKNLESSSLFGPAQVMIQQPPTQNDPLYKYRVTVAYAQKL